MHVIKLRYPWLKQYAGSSEQVKVEVPEPPSMKLSSAAVPETAVYTRQFNKPTGLDSDAVVTLCLSDWQGKLESFLLNEQQLASEQQPLEIEVSGLLEPNNRIEIKLSSDGAVVARLSGEVCLRLSFRKGCL